VWWTIRLEIEGTAGVSGFAINFGVQYPSVPDDQQSNNGFAPSVFYFRGKLDGRS
jgi:hypothetical protein